MTIKPAPATVVQFASANEPTWVIDMRQHYNRTGSYRALDVQRVLGNPSERVEVPAAEGAAPAACRVIES